MKEYADVGEFLYRRIAYPLYEGWLRGRGTLRYLREYQRQQWMSEDELQDIQWRKISALLQHAYEDVPYYRARWGAEGIHWRDVRCMDDFARLPLLTKDDIRSNAQALVADSWRGKLRTTLAVCVARAQWSEARANLF